ncbi:heterokaryon incompatibility protein-domain-containing protein, partial [Clohesyomyces aquaticus]
QEIRLVELLPGNEEDIIRCKFHRSSLRDKPDYVALSYRWGDASTTANIHLDGTSFSIRQNLWNFLHQYRIHMSQSTEKTIFWIDALCIDQQNTRERNHQVALMRLIYSSVWTAFNHACNKLLILRRAPLPSGSV